MTPRSYGGVRMWTDAIRKDPNLIFSPCVLVDLALSAIGDTLTFSFFIPEEKP